MNDYERRRKKVCYQKHLKWLFGKDWRKHYNEEDCKNYVVGNKKIVEQVDVITGKVIKTFVSMAEAERSIHAVVGGSAIGKVCRGEEKTAYGFMWRYA